jgi:mono/diheme cytochrome c family protein
MLGMTRRQRFVWWLRGKPRSEAQVLGNIRRHYREMGMPLDHLTDDQLKAVVVEHSKRMLAGWEATQVTTKQAATALGQLAVAASR